MRDHPGMKAKERMEARRLRAEEGLAITEIGRRVGASKGSVSVWVRDIALTKEQTERLMGQSAQSAARLKGAAVRAKKARELRMGYQLLGRKDAEQGNILHMAGCMLYWGEGSKDKNSLGFANSDPRMMTFFVRFLREFYGVEDQRLRLRCHLYEEQKRDEIEQFWIDQLGLSRLSLCKGMDKVSSLSKRRRGNTLPYGTCHLALHSTEIVQRIFGAIQHYADFEDVVWLA